MTNQPAPPVNPVAPTVTEEFCAPGARKFILIAAILASALGYIDGTVVPIAIPAIRTTLDASLIQAQWVHNAYLLTLASLILVGGAMADRFGLARMFGVGIFCFVGASVLCAFAPSPQFLIVARGIQGVGAAVMVPGSLAVIARAYPRAERGRAIGIWAASAAVTTALGPILGSLALTFGGAGMWRWIFAVNLPMGALALWLLWRHVAMEPAHTQTPVDLIGAILAVCAFFGLAWGLTTADHGGTRTALWLSAGGLALAAFLWVQARRPHPMMPLRLFRSADFSAANLFCFLIYSGLFIVFFFMPMALVTGWGLREIEASLAFAPMSVFMALLSSRAGRLADRFGPAPLLTIGAGIAAAGYAHMAVVALDQRFWDGVLPAMCIVALGMGLLVAPLSTAVMGAVDDSHAGLASGINNAVSRIAGLMSVAAAGGVVTTAYLIAGGPASFGEFSDLPGHAAAMSAGFSAAVGLAAGLNGLGALIAAWLWRHTVRHPPAPHA